MILLVCTEGEMMEEYDYTLLCSEGENMEECDGTAFVY